MKLGYCFLCHCANHTSFNFISIQLLQTSNIVPFLSIFVSSCEERFFCFTDGVYRREEQAGTKSYKIKNFRYNRKRDSREEAI